MADKKRPIGKRSEKTERSPKKTAPASRSAKLNEKPQKTNQMLNALLRYSPLAIICIDSDTNVLLWNPMAEHVFGWSEAEVLGRKNPIVPKEKREEYSRLRTKVQEGTPYSSKELVRQRKDGTLIHLNASSATLRSDDGEVIALVGIFEDITERKKTEETLRESERRFRGAFENAAVGASMVDLTGRFIKVNRFLCEMLGYSEGEMLSKTFSDITHPDDVRIGLDYMKRQIAGEMEFASFEKRYFRKDGSIVHLIISPALIRDDRGAPRYFVGLFQDITERKRAEDLILRSLKEKEVLLKEIHHRVKNNMQVIYSLLNLQAKGSADPAVRAILEESRDRVNSMALIHEKLYRSKDMASIDFKEYLQGLAQGISGTYKRHDVRVSVDMDSLALDVNVGIPCGLIVNELVSNSLKYAFPGGRTGTIRLGIDKNGAGNHVLTVADNGIGFPPEVDFRNTASLGLKLVNVLTGQIHGTLELSRAEGTAFSITFPGFPETSSVM